MVASSKPSLSELDRAWTDAWIMYGSAWKGPHAEQNVLDAIALGYRMFDTANVYPASYNETAMGVALERARAAGLRREDLFIQTKFSRGISKDNCPDGPWDPASCMYDKTADLATQVKQSAQTSLAHLRVAKIDAIVLHDAREPWDDLVVMWRALEDLQMEGKTAHIGVSHAHDAATFRRLLSVARIKPSFVQNPTVALNRWDYEIRLICREHNIVYQAYALNHVVNDFVYQTRAVKQIARRLGSTPQQVVVAMTRRLGLLPLVGPQDPIKQAHALTASRYLGARLTAAEVETLENIAFSGVETASRADEQLQLTVSNHLQSDVLMAWQHPDHTQLRKLHGMHAEPLLVAAGERRTIGARHRFGFYIWEAAEGTVAPLFREGAGKRWVRHVRADSYLDKNEVIVDASVQVTVVNLGPTDVEVFFVPQDARPDTMVSQGVAPGGGGSLYLRSSEGHTFEMRSADGVAWRRTVRRADGDPQLLPVGHGDHVSSDRTRKEL